MRDWKAIAEGLGLDSGALERAIASLDALERDFRPLAESLTPEIQPACEFRIEAGE